MFPGRRLLLPLAGTVLALLAVAAPVPAREEGRPDFSGFWTVRFESTPSNPELLKLIPEGAVFIDDAGAGELGLDDFAGLALTERGRREIAEYDYHDELKRENTCVAPSVVFYMQSPFPMEIHQGTELMVFRMEYFDMVRIIFLDGRDHPPASAPHTRSGHSIGHWEDQDLVVDTTHIASGTIMNNGLSHSDNIRMRERYRLSEDGNILWAIQTYTDREVFAGTGARYMAWRKVPGEYVLPYDCDPAYGE